MSAAAVQAGPPASASGTGAVNPWVIAILVALASFMEVLDTTIVNVALPYIAGGMGVSEDEASWVVTTYLVSNAIILKASPLPNLRFWVWKPSVNQPYMSESSRLASWCRPSGLTSEQSHAQRFSMFSQLGHSPARCAGRWTCERIRNLEPRIPPRQVR